MEDKNIIYSGTYHGKADKPISWEEFVWIFDTIWGKSFHHLPKYPEIIGHIYGTWTSKDGATHQAMSFDEIGEAYKNFETYDISLVGNPDNTPECSIYYLPAKAEVLININALSSEKVSTIINIVKSLFPKFFLEKGETPKKYVKNILRQYKFPKMQKKLLNYLSDTLPKATTTLKIQVGTRDWASLKRDTIATINKNGLGKILTIIGKKGEMDKYFYQLIFSPQAEKKSGKTN